MVTLDKGETVVAARPRRHRGRWFAAGLVLVPLTFGVVFAASSPSSRSMTVSSDLVQPWPFLVDSGELRCDGGAVTLTAGGVRYGLNGTAHARGFASVLPIWAADPAADGLYVSLNPVITLGLALCQ